MLLYNHKCYKIVLLYMPFVCLFLTESIKQIRNNMVFNRQCSEVVSVSQAETFQLLLVGLFCANRMSRYDLVDALTYHQITL